MLTGVVLLAALAAFVSPVGAVLLIVGAVLGSLALLVELRRYRERKRLYARGFGAIFDDQGATFYGDWGPRKHPWSDFGEAFVSGLDDGPILQHLPIRHLHLTGYERFSSYILTPIDFLDTAPEKVLRLLESHPCYPGNRPPATPVMDGTVI